MKLFSVKKGTKGLLMNGDNSKKESIISKCDVIFEREEMITDPVSYVNSLVQQQKDNGKVETNVNEFLSQVFAEGFFIFKLVKGKHTNTDFKYLYVSASDVTMM